MPIFAIACRRILYVIRECSTVSLAAIGLLLLAACGGEDSDFGGKRADGTIEHPVADTIPYYDRDHLSIDTSRTIDEMGEVPEAIVALSDFLKDPEGADTRELDVLVNNTREFYATSVGGGRLVILDGREPRLLEYDLAADEATELAVKGEGPDDLPFAQDLAREGTSIYVAAPPRRISQFDCRPSPCEFQEMARFDFAPLSLALGSDSTIAVLSETPVLSADDPIPDAEVDEHPVRRVGMDGAVHGAFGAAYSSENWLVRSEFIRSAKVRYLKGAGRYVLIFPRFPYLYVYDEAGELHSTYEVSDFIPDLVEFGDFRGVGRNVMRHTSQDNTRIRRVDAVDDRSVLLEIGSVTDLEVEGRYPTSYTEHIDYYLIDLEAERVYHVGSVEHDESDDGRSVALTEEGLVINEDGRLSFLPFER